MAEAFGMENIGFYPIHEWARRGQIGCSRQTNRDYPDARGPKHVQSCMNFVLHVGMQTREIMLPRDADRQAANISV
jgi:hypothetical protein